MVGRRVTYRGEPGTVIRLGREEAALGDQIWAVVALETDPGEAPRWVWVGQSAWSELED